jgi:hypothetical protein
MSSEYPEILTLQQAARKRMKDQEENPEAKDEDNKETGKIPTSAEDPPGR